MSTVCWRVYPIVRELAEREPVCEGNGGEPMEPATAAMIAKAAIAVGTNKKVWTGIASVIAALCLPFILIIVVHLEHCIRRGRS